jgi:hypothetical protein
MSPPCGSNVPRSQLEDCGTRSPTRASPTCRRRCPTARSRSRRHLRRWEAWFGSAGCTPNSAPGEHAITGVTPRARGGGAVRFWWSKARCYPKCYLPLALPVLSLGLLHSQTRHLQSIAGHPKGHEGLHRIANPPSRVRIPAAPLAEVASVFSCADRDAEKCEVLPEV